MDNPVRIIRPSNGQREQDDRHIKIMRDEMSAARRVLADNPKPDSFAGRKTQEPFPQEDV